jgi:hypothetical protein
MAPWKFDSVRISKSVMMEFRISPVLGDGDLRLRQRALPNAVQFIRNFKHLAVLFSAFSM